MWGRDVRYKPDQQQSRERTAVATKISEQAHSEMHKTEGRRSPAVVIPVAAAHPGLTPEEGAIQINMRIPLSATDGNIVVRVGSTQSQPGVNIAIR